MSTLSNLRRYIVELSLGRVILWCYLAWYLTTVIHYFDSTPAIWLNSLGISAIIGCGLLLSVGQSPTSNIWQTVRLFMMPFCVSSFSALIKGRGFFLIFPTEAKPLMISIFSCALLVAVVVLFKRLNHASPVP